MKIVGRISLFLVTSTAMLAAGAYGAIKAEQFFYPNRYPIQEEKREEAGEEIKEMPEEQIIEASVESKPQITADTLYLVEKVNLTDGTVEEQEEQIPVKYIGLNREELVSELSLFDKNPPLTELEQGFETIELTAFSKDRVVVCKYYKNEEEHVYYLMVADHFVVVYEADRETIYMNTDILLSDLDESLQAEIIQGKRIEGEEALYNFLESYSS